MLQSRPLDLNILPERHRPRRVTVATVVGMVVVVALLLGLLPAYGLLTAQQARTAKAQARLAQAEATLVQNQIEQEELGNVEQQIEDVRVLLSRLQAESGALGQERIYRSDGIAATVSSLIPRIEVTTIVQEDNVFTITGEAGSQALVLDYARALQTSGQFANVFILSMVNVDPLGIAPDVEFSIAVQQ
ncbi:MAG: PilN domain-containing protein [Chloroflexota bacterium]|nr:PilN domain-containing protein [Chloroflexota bacterium]